MSFPVPGQFGVIENPLIITPFASNNTPGTVIPASAFLLMDGQMFLLMAGGNFLLMGT
jgi:hypothetical protein